MSETKILTVDQEVLPEDFYDDPAPYYHELRSESPVYWSDFWQCWLISNYEHAKRVLSDGVSFSCSGKSRRSMEKLPTELREKLKLYESNFSTGLINSDPPTHTRLRGLVNQAFIPKVIEELRKKVESTVDDLLDQVQNNDGMDIVQDFAFLLPTTVIAQMLGVENEDRDKFSNWATKINSVHKVRRAKPEDYFVAQQNLEELRAYFRQLYFQRLEKPQTDLMSCLAAASLDGDKFNEDELLATNVTLLMAGFESTMSLISNGMLALLRNPDQLEKLRENPTLVAGAVEELLRYVSPVQRQVRVIKEDVEVGGKELKAGQLASVLIGAANRDPEQFTDPDRLDITRQNNNHIAFGFGRHLCVGNHLARLESQIAINALLRRFPGLHLMDKPPVYEENILLRSLTSLPVGF